jgi:hypothetical protein
MNVDFDRNVSRVRHWHLFEGCVGPYAAALCEEAQYGIQHAKKSVFLESTGCSEQDGPYWFTSCVLEQKLPGDLCGQGKVNK